MISPGESNPFAVLALVAAPAVLTNAMSVLALGSGNRVARVQDRFRETLRDFESAPPGSPMQAMRRRQLDRLQARAQLLLNSMKSFFLALGAFAATTLLAVVGAAFQAMERPLATQLCAVLALAVGVFGVANLLRGCILLVRDSRLAVENLEEQAAFLREPDRP